jgi:putative ABC transport system permease protein
VDNPAILAGDIHIRLRFSRIRVGDVSAPWTIVGVVTDLRLNWYDAEPRPTIYLPHMQLPSPQMYVIVRSTAGSLTLAAPIHSIGQRLDPMQPLSGMQPMDEVIAESVSPIRVLGLLLLIGGALALVFAVIGIYGVLAHWVRSRWREFGIRIALGASPTDVGRLVFRQALSLVVLGLGIGVPCGLAALSVLRNRLFGITAAEPSTVFAVALFIFAIATAASAAPARRALRADTVILLHGE